MPNLKMDEELEEDHLTRSVAMKRWGEEPQALATWQFCLTCPDTLFSIGFLMV